MEIPIVTRVLPQVFAFHPLKDENLQKDAQNGYDDKGNRKGEQPVAGPVGDEIADISAKKIKRSMREIDVAHKTEDQRESACHEKIESAQRDPVEQRVEENFLFADQVDEPWRPDQKGKQQQHCGRDRDHRRPHRCVPSQRSLT